MRFLVVLLMLCLCSSVEAGLFRNRHVRLERQNGRIIFKQITITPRCPCVPDNSVPPPPVQPPVVLPPQPSPQPVPPPAPQNQEPTPVFPTPTSK